MNFRKAPANLQHKIRHSTVVSNKQHITTDYLDIQVLFINSHPTKKIAQKIIFQRVLLAIQFPNLQSQKTARSDPSYKQLCPMQISNGTSRRGTSKLQHVGPEAVQEISEGPGVSPGVRQNNLPGNERVHYERNIGEF